MKKNTISNELEQPNFLQAHRGERITSISIILIILLY